MGDLPWILSLLPYLSHATAVLVALAILFGGTVFVLARRVLRQPRPAVSGLGVPGVAMPGGGSAGAAFSPPAPAADAAGSLRRAFGRAVEKVERGLVRRETRYRQPWVVTLGPAGAGKTSLLAGAGLPQQLREIEDAASGTTWWFFRDGVVVDPRGAPIGDRPLAVDPRYGRRWRALLRQLVEHRPERPLDAILLAVPVDLLAGPTADPLGLAERLAEDVAAARAFTRLRLPVYVLLTRADVLRGFPAFVHALPGALHDDMLGWANPHPLDAPFTIDWIDEAFDSLHGDLFQLQLELMAAPVTPAGADEILHLPDALRGVAESLGRVLGAVFGTPGADGGLLLRGIWVTGAAERAPGDGATPRPLFVRHLLEHKLFAEGGLARPTARAFLSRHRGIRAAQVGIGVVALATVATLAFGASHLAELRRTAVPAVQAVLQDLRALKTRLDRGESERGLPVFEERAAIDLARAVQELDRDWSPWPYPMSWLGGVEQRLGSGLALAYDRAVLGALRVELTRRLESILRAPRSVEGGGAALVVDQVDLLVRRLSEFERMVGLFNGADAGDLARVAEYLSNQPVSAALVAAAERLQPLVADPARQRIELAELRPAVLRRFTDLESQIASGAAAPGLLQQIVSLNDSLRQVAQRGRAAREEDLVVLRQLGEALREADLALGARAEPVALGPEFEDLLRQAATLALVGPQATEQMRAAVSASMRLRRATLAQLESPIVGPLLRQEGQQVYLELSTPARALAQRLDRWLSLPFMAASMPAAREPRVLPRQLWDVAVLEEAARQGEAYGAFASGDLMALPQPIQSIARTLSQARLRGAILDAVARAQRAPASGEGLSRQRQEDELRQEIDGFRAAAPHLQRLIAQAEQHQLQAVPARLAEVASAHALNLIGIIDAQLDLELIYLPRAGSFSWWRPGRPIAVDAFGVNDVAELQRYLATQRLRLGQLALDRAVPLIEVLATAGAGRGRGAGGLAQKWESIVSGLSDYDQGRPNATLTQLERFILVDLAEVDEGNCRQRLGGRDPGERSTDFFLQRRALLRQSLLQQCLALGQADAGRGRNEVAQAFDSYLSGRFPFIEPAQRALAPPVEVAELRDFFRVWDARAQVLRDTATPAAREFNQRMDGARAFFAPYLGADGPGRRHVLDVEFRVNQAAEVGGRDIIEWAIEIGDQRLALGQPRRPLDWRRGQPIRVVLRWARNGPVVPEGDPAQPELRVDNRTATFALTGQWALIDLLQRFQVPDGEAGRLADRRPHVLRFAVPAPALASAGPARVFIRIGVARPEADGQAEQAVVLPGFPSRAP